MLSLSKSISVHRFIENLLCVRHEVLGNIAVNENIEKRRCSICGLEQIIKFCRAVSKPFKWGSCWAKKFFFFLSIVYRSLGGFPKKNNHKYIQVLSLFQFVHTSVILNFKPFANRNCVQLCLMPSIIAQKIGFQLILFKEIEVLETVSVTSQM